MSESEALTLSQADEMVVAALNLGSVVAKHFGIVPLVEVFDYIVAHTDERKWLLGLLGLTDAAAFSAGPSAQLAALGGLGSLLEIVNLLKEYAPLIKQYMPQIKQALELFKVLFDLWKGASQSVPDSGEPPRKPSF